MTSPSELVIVYSAVLVEPLGALFCDRGVNGRLGPLKVITEDPSERDDTESVCLK